jgi:hypothetical protein
MIERLKEELKIRFRDFVLVITPLFQSYLIALVAFVFVVLPVALIMCNLKLLRWRWLPAFFAYWLFLRMVYRLVIRHRRMREERFLYGDELFFQLYPKEKLREERRRTHEKQKQEKRRTKRGGFPEK